MQNARCLGLWRVVDGRVVRGGWREEGRSRGGQKGRLRTFAEDLPRPFLRRPLPVSAPRQPLQSPACRLRTLDKQPCSSLEQSPGSDRAPMDRHPPALRQLRSMMPKHSSPSSLLRGPRRRPSATPSAPKPPLNRLPNHRRSLDRPRTTKTARPSSPITLLAAQSSFCKVSPPAPVDNSCKRS